MRTKRADPFITAFYGIAAFLMTVYLTAAVLSLTQAPISPVWRIVLLLLACLSAFLGARVPRLYETEFDREACRRRVRRVLWLCLALYLHLILTFTLFDAALGRDFFSIFTADATSRAYYLKWHVNLSPLHTVRTIYINGFRNGLITPRFLLINLPGNLIIFVPFAFFLPYLFPRINRFLKFFALMLLFSAVIEACQFVMMCGSCDIDDIILNVGGALPFWFLFKLPPIRKLIRYLTVT